MTVYFQSFWGTILMYESGKISKKKIMNLMYKYICNVIYLYS